MMLWSLSSFFLHGDYFPRETLIINEFIVATGFLVPIVYFQFISHYTGNSSLLSILVSSVIFLVILAIDFSGLVVKNSNVTNNLVNFDVSLFFYLFFIASLILEIISVFYLVNKYRKTIKFYERRQIICLITGLCIMFISCLSLFWDQFSMYPIEHAGNIINIAILAYMILRYKLFDVRVPGFISNMLHSVN
jgi:hypothetical protein